MRKLAAAVWACCFLSAAQATAQTQPASLATLFADIYGPNGLVLSSDDVQLDGTNHAAHFNSAFQSDFQLVNIALTSQLTSVPLPSPASGFTYQFDPATGTFVRSTRSRPDPVRSRRNDRQGPARVRLLTPVLLVRSSRWRVSDRDPGRFSARLVRSGGGRTDVVSTLNTIEATVSQFTGALTYGLTSRIDLSLAVPVVRTRLSLLSNAKILRLGTGANVQVHYFRDLEAIGGYGSTRQFFSEGSAGGLGDLLVRVKTTIVREGTRAMAAGVDVRLPTGDEQNLLGAGAAGLRPFAAFSSSYGPFAPHANIAYQWNGRSVLAGDVRADIEGDLPDQFLYAAGSDLGVNSRFSIVFDVSARVLNSRSCPTYTLAAGRRGNADLPDIRSRTDPLVDNARGLASERGAKSGDFNMRFTIGGRPVRSDAPLLASVASGPVSVFVSGFEARRVASATTENTHVFERATRQRDAPPKALTNDGYVR